MSELKPLPCPFCGGAARAFKRTCDKDTRYDPSDRAFPIVRCGACGACAEGDDWAEVRTAIDRWNRRTQPAQEVPRLTDVEWMNIVNKNHAWFGYSPEDVAHEVFKLTESALLAKMQGGKA